MKMHFVATLAPILSCAACSLITDVDHLRNGVRDVGVDGASDVGVDSAPSDAAVLGRLYLASGTINDGTHPNDLIVADVHDDGTTGDWSTSPKTPPADCLTCAAARSGPYVYLVGPDQVGDQPKTVRFAKITGNDLSDWSLGTPLPTARGRLAVVATDAFLYVLGGESGSTVLDEVLVSPINASDGSNGAWTATTPLPGPRFSHAAATSHGHVWVLGGASTATAGGGATDYYEGTIAGDGTISGWKTLTDLPVGPFGPQAVVANDHLYVLGGYDVRPVYYAAIDATTGELHAWTTGAPLGSAHAFFAAAETGGFLYVLAGFDDASTATSVVEVSQLASDGSPGAWRTLAPLPSTRVFHVAFATP